MQSNQKKHQPACLLSHDLLNKLSAIIGFCDLLMEKAEEKGEDQECVRQLGTVNDLARSAVKTLLEHQCELSVVIRRSAKPQKHVLV
jgi:light-regulated signal transduction histidine kinase (bacteriophytochrome)